MSGPETRCSPAPTAAAIVERIPSAPITIEAAGKSGRPRTRDPHLFIAERRRPGGEHEPLTDKGIYHAIRDAAERAEFDHSRIHPHLLRASAITRTSAKGVHPTLASAITGVSVAVIAQQYSFPTEGQQWEAAMNALMG